jgi:endonuclease YncB( thermonuclease family)
MRRFLAPQTFFVFLFLIFLNFVTGAVLADLSAARVVGIKDGDTVTVVMNDGQQREIRLAGIDAPEAGQAFGQESTAHLSALVDGKNVNLDCTGEESYKRLICKIQLLNGEDVDLDQIKAGMAWHYKQYQRLQTATDRSTYGAAEDEARRARIGLWASKQPVQPG